MNINIHTIAGLGAFCGLALTIPSFATDKALLDVLVDNGTITRAQADEIRGKSATVVTPNRNTVSELKIRGRIQGQYAYSEGSNSNTGVAADDFSSFELRRVRLGVQGRLFEDFRFLVEANVLTNTDLDSATLSYTAIPEANITLGKAKPQFGHEENTPSASILTIERSRLTGIFNGAKPIGLRVHGSSGMFGYYAGVFNGASPNTARMGSGNDSYLFNLSGELKLDEMVDGQLRFGLDYLGSSKASSYYSFDDAIAISGHFVSGPFDFCAEYIVGERHNDDKLRGWYIMPSFYFIPKTLQMVGRYEQVRGDDGVSVGHNRYAADVPGIYRAGNRYNAFYVGLNSYISGDNTKLMAGIERAENKNSASGNNERGRTTTFVSGIRMQY